MIRFKPLSTTIAIVGVLIALLVGLHGPLGKLVASHWREKLHNASDEEARPLLRQAAALGESGIPVLVEALGSPRESVARAAREVLDSLLDRWQEHRHRGDSPKLGILARELATRVGSFGPTARDDAADLVTRILLWPPDTEEVDRGSLVAACEEVLQTVSRAEGLRGLPAQAVVSSELDGEAELAADEASTTGSIEELASLPGGGLPVAGFDMPDIIPHPVGESHAAEDDEGSVGHGSHPYVAPDEPMGRPPRLLHFPEREAGKPLDADSSQQQIAPLPPPLQSQRARSEPLRAMSLEDAAEATEGRAGLESVDPLDLIHQLRSTDSSLVERAKSELSRRGFGTLHFELARRLLHTNPRIRIELARALPAMRSVDATTWLLWLSHDEDADVRLAAIGLMATTVDPALLAKIERIAAADSDPRIRRQARRLASQRR